MWKTAKLITVLALIAGLLWWASPPVRALDGTSSNVTITVLVTPLVAPVVTNGVGASNVGSTTARLNGEITSTGNENPTTTVFYGQTDGGTTAASWTNNVSLGVTALGTFYYDASGLSELTQYFYRMYTENSAGSDWADSTENFTTSEQCEAPTGLTLTDLGYITVTANWTRGGGTTYTLLRGSRSDYPATVTDGELIYYGDAESANTTGLALDTSTYYVSAWGYLADNVTYSSSYAKASIGGSLMSDIADALNVLADNVLLFHGILLFLPLLFLSVLAFWKENPVLFFFTGAVAIITGLNSPDMLAGLYETSELGVTVGIVIILYALFCVGMGIKLVFWNREEE